MTTRKIAPNLPYLDGLRALAALYVLLHHAVLQYYEFDSSSLSGLKKASISIFFYGHLAVNLFIVLSGFCLMLPVMKADYHVKGGFMTFLKKRIIRILPPYYFAILLSVLLIALCIGDKTGTHWDYSVPITFSDISTHILLISDFFLSNSFKINHSLWSIPVEFRIYLFFPFLIYLWRKIGPVYTLLVSVVISLVMQILMSGLKSTYPDINLELAGVNPYIILFTLGMLAAHFSFSDQAGILIHKKWLLEILLLMALIAFAAVEKYNTESLSKSSDIAFGICCFFFLIICSKKQQTAFLPFDKLRDILSWQPLAFLGTFSYSLYLIHAPLLQVLTIYLINPLGQPVYTSTFLLIAASAILLIPAAYIFFLLFEKPFMVLGRKLNAKKLDRTLVAG